ncbi:hypothetical protein CP960_00600 [Malaciobacter halophilus]|uniref:SAM-dependent methyltransferase n=2 Tax=Malaciobacter halophilus TaxID=197482 RepID=A0A2N1J6G2_9BACT|nr:SAM-dependent methyltransferase [Malaciobacter halophilus]AXH10693.1 SAM-dependent methyltransferase, MidA family [Malaciobacter halophilus]PKI82167.1 hypothetical protein CP960_00600 [Malaciobacter halophilus]
MKKFSDFMNSWLYAKDGYYATYKQIGKEGDFFTSVSTSSFFGGAIANKILCLIKQEKLSKDATIVEIGAHHGYLLADIIQFIYTFDAQLLKSLNFVIIERFENLKKIQKKYLYDCFGDEINLTFYDDIKSFKTKEAFVVANEIFDAFACELVYTKNDNLYQAFTQNNKIHFEPCKDENLIKHCKKYNIKKGEVCLEYKTFIDTLLKNIHKLFFLTFDYGDKYPRNDFSCRVYKNHKVHAIFEDNLDLNSLYKNSDITYDVHFNYLSELFSSCKSIDFNTQANRLIEFEITKLLSILKKHVSYETYLKETQKVKILLEPTGMGDRFKSLFIYK